jgi:hypothetical protein
LWDRVEFVYTFKHGSWLNRRIDSIEKARREVVAWQNQRDQLNAKIDWQFTSQDARIRLNDFEKGT